MIDPTEQPSTDPRSLATDAGEVTVHAVNMASAITGHAYPVCGDTIANITHAYPRQDT